MRNRQWRENPKRRLTPAMFDLAGGDKGGIIKAGGEKVLNVLPNADKAVIPIEKFTKYALSPTNSKGKWVAFQEALGYNIDNANLLLENIKRNLERFPVEVKGDKGYGETYAVLMEITGANGKTANVMTAWLDDKATGKLRLTSVYIKKKRGGSGD